MRETEEELWEKRLGKKNKQTRKEKRRESLKGSSLEASLLLRKEGYRDWETDRKSVV